MKDLGQAPVGNGPPLAPVSEEGLLLAAQYAGALRTCDLVPERARYPAANKGRRSHGEPVERLVPRNPAPGTGGSPPRRPALRPVQCANRPGSGGQRSRPVPHGSGHPGSPDRGGADRLRQGHPDVDLLRPGFANLGQASRSLLHDRIPRPARPGPGAPRRGQPDLRQGGQPLSHPARPRSDGDGHRAGQLERHPRRPGPQGGEPIVGHPSSFRAVPSGTPAGPPPGQRHRPRGPRDHRHRDGGDRLRPGETGPPGDGDRPRRPRLPFHQPTLHHHPNLRHRCPPGVRGRQPPDRAYPGVPGRACPGRRGADRGPRRHPHLGRPGGPRLSGGGGPGAGTGGGAGPDGAGTRSLRQHRSIPRRITRRG